LANGDARKALNQIYLMNMQGMTSSQKPRRHSPIKFVKCDNQKKIITKSQDSFESFRFEKKQEK
jgi:hypothetical protein